MKHLQISQQKCWVIMAFIMWILTTHGIPYEKPEVLNRLITLLLEGELESETVDGVKYVSVV